MEEQRKGDFGTWKLTKEQAARIMAFDMDAIKAFMEDNHVRIRQMAHNYARKRNLTRRGNIIYYPEEMISQLYLDLPFLSLVDACSVSMEIWHRSFAWCPYGGYMQRKSSGMRCGRSPWVYCPEDMQPVSLDACAYGEDSDTTFYEFITDETYDADYRLMNREALTSAEIVGILSDLFTPVQQKHLFALLQGWSPQVQKSVFGNGAKTYMCLLRYKLVLQYDEIVERLTRFGIEIPAHLVGLIPENYSVVLEKHNRKLAQQRERMTKRRQAARAQEGGAPA